jgi:hypothetical protein
MKSRSKVGLTLAAGFIFVPAASPRREKDVSIEKITHRPIAVKSIPGIRRRQVQEHGNFIAFIRVLEAVYTLAPNVIRQIMSGNFLKPQPFKKLRARREGENSSQSDGSRFRNAFFHQAGADSGSLKIR